MSNLGKLSREGGLATIQVIDLYIHLKLPAMRAGVSGFSWPVDEKGKKLTDGKVVSSIMMNEFGIDVDSILVTKKGEKASNSTVLLSKRLTGKSKKGSTMPFSNGQSKDGFKLQLDKLELVPLDVAIPGSGKENRGGYVEATLRSVAQQIANSRQLALSKARGIINDQAVRQAYSSGNYFEFSKSASGLGPDKVAKGTNISTIVTSAWDIPEALESGRTPAQNLAIATAVLQATTDAEPGVTSRSGESTKAFVDEMLADDKAKSGMRSIKVLSMIKHMISFSPTLNKSGLDPQSLQIRNQTREAFRQAVSQKTGALAATGVAAKAQVDALKLVGTKDVKLKSTAEVKQAAVGNNPQIHSILMSAFQIARSMGLSPPQVLDGIWYSYSASGIDSLLPGLNITSRGKKFTHSNSARSMLQASATPSGLNISFPQGDMKLSEDDYSRYVFDRLIMAFVRHGAERDIDGSAKISSNVRSDKPANRKVGLAGTEDSALKNLDQRARSAGGQLGNEQVMFAMVPVLSKVIKSQYNVTALTAIANMIGAPIPQRVFFRDTLQAAIVDRVYAIYSEAAESQNRGAVAVLVAALGIKTSKYGEPSKAATSLGPYVELIRARINAHYGLMTPQCMDTDALTNDDLKTIAKLQGVSIKTANREQICKALAAKGVSQAGSDRPLSGNREEPAARRTGSTSTSKASTPAAAPVTQVSGSFNTAMFPAGGAVVAGKAPTPSGSGGFNQSAINNVLQQGGGGDFSFN